MLRNQRRLREGRLLYAEANIRQVIDKAYKIMRTWNSKTDEQRTTKGRICKGYRKHVNLVQRMLEHPRPDVNPTVLHELRSVLKEYHKFVKDNVPLASANGVQAKTSSPQLQQSNDVVFGKVSNLRTPAGVLPEYRRGVSPEVIDLTRSSSESDFYMKSEGEIGQEVADSLRIEDLNEAPAELGRHNLWRCMARKDLLLWYDPENDYDINQLP